MDVSAVIRILLLGSTRSNSDPCLHEDLYLPSSMPTGKISSSDPRHFVLLSKVHPVVQSLVVILYYSREEKISFDSREEKISF